MNYTRNVLTFNVSKMASNLLANLLQPTNDVETGNIRYIKNL